MPAITPDEVRAAAARLRGQLVASPTIGSTWPWAGAAEVRWKADLVQPGGSGWFRGFHHWLLRSFGSFPGVSFVGPPPRLLAAALAAQLHRLPFTAFVVQPLPGPLASAISAAGGSVDQAGDPEQAAAELQQRTGTARLPLAEHAVVAAGLATAGLELAAALPADCAVAYAASDVTAALRAGLAAAGRTLEVIGVDRAASTAAIRDQLVVAVALQHRLQLGAEGAAVLAAAAAHRGGGPVGALVME